MAGACWIQGFYIYRNLWNRTDETAYFGVTKDIEMDGLLPSGALCNTQPKLRRDFNSDCKPMEKTFYLQVKDFKIFSIA